MKEKREYEKRISDWSSDVGSSDHQKTESLRWVRQRKGIGALHGDDGVELEVEGIRSGSVTYGHRLHHAGQITIGNAGDYVEKLRLCHVIVDQNERQQLVENKAKEAAAAARLILRADQGMATENPRLP